MIPFARGHFRRVTRRPAERDWLAPIQLAAACARPSPRIDERASFVVQLLTQPTSSRNRCCLVRSRVIDDSRCAILHSCDSNDVCLRVPSNSKTTIDKSVSLREAPRKRVNQSGCRQTLLLPPITNCNTTANVCRRVVKFQRTRARAHTHIRRGTKFDVQTLQDARAI